MSDNMREISDINKRRAEIWHRGSLDLWSLSDWGIALAGEVGELCNVIKKLNRVRDGLPGNKETPQELSIALWKEMADVYLYLDLIAQAAKIDLPSAVTLKFNETSVKNGFEERL